MGGGLLQTSLRAGPLSHLHPVVILQIVASVKEEVEA